MFRQLQGRWQRRSLQQRYLRHCQHIFPFDRHLHKPAISYLEHCCFGATPTSSAKMATSPLWRAVFAHRIKGQEVDASYLSPRLTIAPAVAWEVALATLTPLTRTYLLATMQELSQYGIPWAFDGLGWRCHQRELWVHCRVPTWSSLREGPWASLCRCIEHSGFSCRDEASISICFCEEKIACHSMLLYPESATSFAAFAPSDDKGVLHALKVSSQDGMIDKVFVGGSLPRLDHRLNHLGRHMLKRYERWDEEIEALIFHRADDCTLFFA